jgi:hypothetical protein
MAELLEAVTSWPTLVLVVVVFGFAPGFCLRLIVLAYPRGDPRRDELIAELYTVPRVQRPLWVAEQLEVALFEGLAHRLSAVRRARQRRARAKIRRVMRLAVMAVVVPGLVPGLVSGLVVGFVVVPVSSLMILGWFAFLDREKRVRKRRDR